PVLAQKLPMLCNNKRQILPAAKRYCALISLSNLFQSSGIRRSLCPIGVQVNTVLFCVVALRPTSCNAFSVSLTDSELTGKSAKPIWRRRPRNDPAGSPRQARPCPSLPSSQPPTRGGGGLGRSRAWG